MHTYWLFTIFLICLVRSDDALLKMSQNHQCIKDVLDDFIKKQTCHQLSESQKSLLAIKMTNCLNLRLGKASINECDSLRECKIQGDNWNTFTTFFTHIDNLCHFYWSILHHERTQKLVGDLSSSALLSQNIFKKNYESTQKILGMQESIKQLMNDSFQYNKKLSETLVQSEAKIQNITLYMEEFLDDLNKELTTQYSSIISTMSAISKGIQGVNAVQNLMISKVNSISGMLYFFILTLVFGLLTSMPRLRKIRMTCFGVLLGNILIQIIIPQFVLSLVGIRFIRFMAILIELVIMVKACLSHSNQNIDGIKTYMDDRFDTKRIKRIFKQLLQEQNNRIQY